MIGRLRGALQGKQPPWLELDVNGVVYELEAPIGAFYHLPALGETVTLYTHLQVRDDTYALYGFLQAPERTLFRTLIKVTGVGAKLALAILSGMEVETFARCIQRGDLETLRRLPGVGRKTAERLVLELRDRLGDRPFIASPLTAGSAPLASPLEDAVQALIALGYKPQEASRMVRRVDHADGLSREELIRQALKVSLGDYAG